LARGLDLVAAARCLVLNETFRPNPAEMFSAFRRAASLVGVMVRHWMGSYGSSITITRYSVIPIMARALAR
jgi:hypothetical protein